MYTSMCMISNQINKLHYCHINVRTESTLIILILICSNFVFGGWVHYPPIIIHHPHVHVVLYHFTCRYNTVRCNIDICISFCLTLFIKKYLIHNRFGHVYVLLY